MFAGFEIDYSAPMNPSTAGLSTNYKLFSTTTRRVKNLIRTTLKPIPFKAAYTQANGKYSVILTVKSSTPFAQGGQITIVDTPPNGVSSASGALLNASDSSLKILPKSKTVTPV